MTKMPAPQHTTEVRIQIVQLTDGVDVATVANQITSANGQPSPEKIQPAIDEAAAAAAAEYAANLSP